MKEKKEQDRFKSHQSIIETLKTEENYDKKENCGV